MARRRRGDEGLGRADVPPQPAVKAQQPLRDVSLATPSQLADYLQVSRAWVKRRIAEGMPHDRISDRQVRFDRTQVIQWLRERRTKTGQ